MDIEKNYCAKVEDYLVFLGNNPEIEDVFEEYLHTDPEDFIHYIRNFQFDKVAQSEYSKQQIDKIFRSSLSMLLRSDFDYLGGEHYCCTEDQLRELLMFSGGKHGTESKILKNWEKWFAPTEEVNNETYETYDFARSENVINYTIDQLNLPPLQHKYARYYLAMRSEFSFSKTEQAILAEVSKNLLKNEEKMINMFDEFIKS